MKFPSTLCWLLSASLCVPVTAQETKKLEKEPSASERQVEIRGLIENLGSERYAKRRAAQEGLKEIGPKALEALKQAAEEHADTEVRWRARDLMAEIEAGDEDPFKRGSSPLGLLRSRGDESLAEIIERLDLDFDLRGLDDFGDFRIQMLDLQDQMGRMNKRLESQLKNLQFNGQGFSSSGTSVKIGPDAVRVEVKEKNADGSDQTKVYEAPDMESFREKYPEVAERYLNKAGVFMIGPDDLRLNFGPGPIRRLERSPATPRVRSEAHKGARLGVSIQSLAPEVGEFLGLEAGQGLVVREVLDDSLAESLAIQEGDVITAINGESIFSPADIARVLKEIPRGETVRVKINRRGAERELQAEKLEDAEKPSLERVESKKPKTVIR